MSGRGRGKRIITTTTTAVNTVVETTENKTTLEKGTKKTSKKKQFPVIAIVGPDGIEGNLLPEQRRPLIVHLRIQSKDVPMNDMPIAYDPAPPNDAQPYDINADDPFYEGVEQFDNQVVMPGNVLEEIKQIEQPITPITPSVPAVTTTTPLEIDYYNLKSTLLVQFKDSAEVKTIPQTSDVACFWCCHTFTNRPVVLPMRDNR